MYDFYLKTVVRPHPRGRTAQFLLTMKLTVLIIFAAMLQVSANTFAQKITLNKKKAVLMDVLQDIRRQSGYDFVFTASTMEKAQPVDINVKAVELNEVLKLVFASQPLDYIIKDKSVVVSQKVTSAKSVLITEVIPITVNGKVTDTTGAALPGATVKIKGQTNAALTNSDGTFSITAQPGDEVTISFIGFKPYVFTVIDNLPFQSIVLHANYNELNEVVVNTGYQSLPKERSTGSFVQVDNKLLSRSTGVNILDRLNGVVSALRFNGLVSSNISTNPSNRTLGINIRGESTLSGNVSRDPLIVLDNFPYEGNISNINPNDIENITVLKDAAAASIWGARSGNGVIVITTKKGRQNQPLIVEVNSNITIQNKPDLYYDRNYLDAGNYIDVETYLFKQGYFDSYLNDKGQPPVSPVVDILASQKSRPLTSSDAAVQISALKKNDVRRDYEKYIYQKAVKQQYSIALRGGTTQNSYTFSAGYDQNQDNLVRNGFDRITVNALNTYTPIRNLEITTGINYSQNNTDQNNKLYWGSGISVGGPIAGIYPYAQFADEKGNALAIVKDYRAAYANNAQASGFLDWNYRPLDELNLADTYTKVNDLILKASLRYKFKPYLNAEFQYQNERQTVGTHNYQTVQTYNARNLINRFTIINPTTKAPTYQVPVGGMLDLGQYDLIANNFRGQLNYNQTFTNKHNITGLAGAEVRQLSSNSFTRNSLGYNDQFGTAASNLNYTDYLAINPTGYAQIPAPDGSERGTLNRYISYFANGSYTYDERYIFTISGRKDGANIFGVKTNDKVTPLWSAGIGWIMSKASFYKLDWLPYLKGRFSYGFNGNVYNGTAFATGKYTTASLTGAPAILNLTAPNPDLSWERVKNINIGVDFATKNNTLSGTLEYYLKHGENLIENIPLNTSTGFLSFYGNAAATNSKVWILP